MRYSTIKSLFYVVVAAGLFGLTACDSTIDRDPEQSIPSEDAFETAQNVQAALNGAYSGLQDGDVYGGSHVMFGDVGAGGETILWDGSFDEFTNANTFTVQADNGIILGLWEAHYDVINRVNAIIENTSTDIEGLDQEDVDDIVGQAKYIRADMYFNLVRWFGEPFEAGQTNNQPAVPLRTSPALSFEDTDPEPRATVAEIYTQIRNDLEDAIDVLEVNTDPRRVGLHAANAKLAIVSLYQGRYQEAADLAKTVENSQPYSLSGSPIDPYVNEQSGEIVFAVGASAIDNSGVNAHPGAFYLPSETGGRGEAFPAASLVAEAEQGDIRTGVGEVDGDSLFYSLADDLRTNKWTNTDLGDDTIVLRVAEMFLVRAEALARMGNEGEARAYVNAIRNRAGLPDVDPSLSGQALIDEIIRQRRFEFAFEGKYRLTLDRLERTIRTPQGAEIEADNPQRLFPIPEDVIETNNEIGQEDQNPGF